MDKNPFSVEDNPVWRERKAKFLMQARMRGHDLQGVYPGIAAWIGTCRLCRGAFIAEKVGVYAAQGGWEKCDG